MSLFKRALNSAPGVFINGRFLTALMKSPALFVCLLMVLIVASECKKNSQVLTTRKINFCYRLCPRRIPMGGKCGPRCVCARRHGTGPNSPLYCVSTSIRP
ncbi:hypothetical protein V5799_007685 [Amblyomma americanum]|uniref:Uncharacterized protein n=1 Tax=Amblyomma americanum TaxID=6943 RepID=A0AAQ4FF95_AMBAM